MKPWLILPALLLASLPALAELPREATAQYAMEWPVKLPVGETGGAYRVELPEEVYEQVTRHDARDLEILDSDGSPVPSALFAAEAVPAREPGRLDIPFFDLGPVDFSGGQPSLDGLRVRARRDGAGDVVELLVGEVQSPGDGSSAWLLDARLPGQDPRAPDVAALELEWDAHEGPLDSPYRVEGSDDLNHWEVLVPSVRLLDLQRDGRRLQQRRIDLPRSMDYLRLVPLAAGPGLELSGVKAVPATNVASPPARWMSLSPAAGTEGEWLYTLPARIPASLADLSLEGAHAAHWRLESREQGDAPWRLRAGPWLAYRVDAGDMSAPRVLGQSVRDRSWRLSSEDGTGEPPALRLGYRPESIVFVAQGTPPYRLVAGSARTRRAEYPVRALVDALRARHGEDWQPAAASLGEARELAGDAALQPAPPERDWRSWSLWFVLVLGALVVGGLALSLLRRTPAGG